MHLPRDASPLRGCAERCLLVALTLEPRRLLLQRDQQLAPLADHQAKRGGCDGQAGDGEPVLELLRSPSAAPA